MRVLDEVAQSERAPGVTEIARALGCATASVFRSLDALSRAGLVSRYRESSRYVPGPAAERLRRSAIALFPIREVCLPYLRQLASISGEAVSLHVRIGWYAVRIYSVPGMGEMTNSLPPRRAQRLAESGAGRAILARMGVSVEKQRDALVFALPGGAAVIIEAAGLERQQLRECQQVIANIEALAAAQPALFVNPFGHLNPDAIVL